MKTKFKALIISGVVTVTMFTSCQKEESNSDNVQYARILDVSTDGTSTVVSRNMELAFTETSVLTDTEIATLLKMKDEEKLARDVYSALYQKWGGTMFNRISVAENNHLNAIISLLKYYGSADTLVSEAGIFADTSVQILYNDLVAKGSTSNEEGYRTGALIEEMDITDLKDAIATTANANITMVYENLERGSRNHLRAFSNQLTNLAIVYIPVYLTQVEYDQIINSAMEKGKQYIMKGQCNGKGNGDRKGQGNGKRKGKS